MAQRRGFSAAAPRKRRGSPNGGSPSPSPFARAARAHLRRMPDFSKLFSPHAKEPPCWAALFAWRREEDFLRLRLESVAARRMAVRLPLLPLRAPLARTSGECRTSQSSSPRTQKSRPVGQPFLRGAEKRIRTSGRVTPVTRFPIVLLKPLRHLCKSSCYRIIFLRKRQLFLREFRQKFSGNFGF